MYPHNRSVVEEADKVIGIINDIHCDFFAGFTVSIGFQNIATLLAVYFVDLSGYAFIYNGEEWAVVQSEPLHVSDLIVQNVIKIYHFTFDSDV